MIAGHSDQIDRQHNAADAPVKLAVCRFHLRYFKNQTDMENNAADPPGKAHRHSRPFQINKQHNAADPPGKAHRHSRPLE